MYRTHNCGELRMSDVGQEVTLSGWVQVGRDFGALTFVDLRDRYGITQLVFDSEDDAALCEQARKLGREFVITASGLVRERTNMALIYVSMDEKSSLDIRDFLHQRKKDIDS